MSDSIMLKASLATQHPTDVCRDEAAVGLVPTLWASAVMFAIWCCEARAGTCCTVRLSRSHHDRYERAQDGVSKMMTVLIPRV